MSKHDSYFCQVHELNYYAIGSNVPFTIWNNELQDRLQTYLLAQNSFPALCTYGVSQNKKDDTILINIFRRFWTCSAKKKIYTRKRTQVGEFHEVPADG